MANGEMRIVFQEEGRAEDGRLKEEYLEWVIWLFLSYVSGYILLFSMKDKNEIIYILFSYVLTLS